MVFGGSWISWGQRRELVDQVIRIGLQNPLNQKIVLDEGFQREAEQTNLLDEDSISQTILWSISLLREFSVLSIFWNLPYKLR